jgi:hypothetical protein
MVGQRYPILPEVEEISTPELGNTKRTQVTATYRSHLHDERNKINQAVLEEVTNFME